MKENLFPCSPRKKTKGLRDIDNVATPEKENKKEEVKNEFKEILDASGCTIACLEEDIIEKDQRITDLENQIEENNGLFEELVAELKEAHDSLADMEKELEKMDSLIERLDALEIIHMRDQETIKTLSTYHSC